VEAPLALAKLQTQITTTTMFSSSTLDQVTSATSFLRFSKQSATPFDPRIHWVHNIPSTLENEWYLP